MRLRPVRFGVYCSCVAIRIVLVAPARMAFRTARRTVNHGNELWMAVKANLSDRYLDKAAKSFGKQNTIESGAWQ
jgi:hypothetical protein